MRAFMQSLYTGPTYARVLEWGKLVSIAGSAQILVQAVGLISGILVIRLLSPQEYALYTMANVMLATMALLADGGISTSIMSQGGKVWQDREKLGKVLVTGFNLRKKFAIASMLVATPVLLYFLVHHGASWPMSLVILLAIMPTFYTALFGNLLEIALKLRQDIPQLQKTQVGVNLGRLFLLGLSLFAFPWAFVAILAAGFPQIWANRHLRKLTTVYADLSLQPDPAIRREILVFVKRILPGVIYYCLYGQVTIWILSVFGSTKAIAQIGALGRLAMILNIFGVLFTTLVLPRFARLPNNCSVVLGRYIQIHIGFLILSACIICAVSFFPSYILLVLGKDYTDLGSELILNITGSCIGLIAGVSFGLFTSRGWAINPAISIPLSMGSIIAGVLIFNVSTLQGALVLNLFIILTQALMNFLYGFTKIINIK